MGFFHSQFTVVHFILILNVENKQGGENHKILSLLAVTLMEIDMIMRGAYIMSKNLLRNLCWQNFRVFVVRVFLIFYHGVLEMDTSRRAVR